MTRRTAIPLTLLVWFVGVQILHLMGFAPALISKPLDWLVGRVWAGDLIVIGGCAFAENTVFLNVLVPGALPILFGMAATHGRPAAALGVFSAIFACSLAGQIASFFLGRHGTMLLAIRLPQMTPHQKAQPVFEGIVFWHPNFGSAYAYGRGAAGEAPLRYLKRYFVYGLFWNAAWGIGMYAVGSHIPRVSGQELTWPFVAFLFIWLLKGLWADARRPDAPA